jgi:hypothetical protein
MDDGYPGSLRRCGDKAGPIPINGKGSLLVIFGLVDSSIAGRVYDEVGIESDDGR